MTMGTRETKDDRRLRAERLRSAGSAQADPAEARNRELERITQRRGQALNLEARGISEAEEGLVALEGFSGRYPQIARDPDAAEVARAMDRLQGAAGDSRPSAERYEEIGELLSEVLDHPEFAGELALDGPDEVAARVLARRTKSASEVLGEMRALRRGKQA
jgi:hypothetical protein